MMIGIPFFAEIEFQLSIYHITFKVDNVEMLSRCKSFLSYPVLKELSIIFSVCPGPKLLSSLYVLPDSTTILSDIVLLV